MNRYLLDTSHIGEAIGQVSVVRDRVQRSQKEGDVFGSIGPVLCELLAGVVVRKDLDKCRRRLERLLQIVRVWPVDMAIAERYAKVYHELRNIGRPVSQVDMMLAAIARHLNATLLTTDQDFQVLPDIRTENWIGN